MPALAEAPQTKTETPKPTLTGPAPELSAEWGTGVRTPSDEAPATEVETPATDPSPDGESAAAATPTEEIDPTAAAAAPGEGAEAVDPNKPAGAEVPEPDDLDVLAESLGLKPFGKSEKADPKKPISLADLDTPEKLAKAINPDGKASEKQQLENLQRLIGSQSEEVKESRAIKQFADAYAPFMAQTADGKAVMHAVKLAQALPPEVLQAQLDEAGLVVLPKEHLEHAAQFVDYPPDVVDAIIADKDMPYLDKVAQIEGDPKLAARAEALKLDRQKTINQHRQVARQQMHETFGQLRTKYAGLFKELETPQADGQSLLAKFNAVLPPEFGGAERATALFFMATGYHSLQPGTMRKTATALRTHFEAQMAKKARRPGPGNGAAGDRAGAPVQDMKTSDEQRNWGVR